MFVPDRAFQGACQSASAKSARTDWKRLLTRTTIALIVALPFAQVGTAAAQSAKNLPTQNQQDPRRAPHSANVTTEARPDLDQEGRDDENRVADAYQPKGIELGSFLLLPQLETDVAYNTNVFAQEKDAKSDVITRLAPELKLRSRFSTHALNITARAEQFLFKQYSADNHMDVGLLADGRFDIERGSELTDLLDVGQRYEDRGSPDAAGGKRPTRTRSMQNSFGGKHQAGRYTFSGELVTARRVFDDVTTDSGSLINNSDRDRWENALTVRGAYEMFPGYSAVLEAGGNNRRYDDQLDDAGVNRSSTGYKVNAGIGVDISQLVRGDFLVGYFKQNYRDSKLQDPSGLSFRAAFNWTPSRLTVIVPSLERSVLETTQGRASSMVRSGFNLLVRHEYQRNIILTGIGSVNYDEFEGINRSAWTYEARTRLVYAFNPEVYAGGEIGYRQRNSELAGQSYKQGVSLVRLGLRM